jgi:hypothetical protein
MLAAASPACRALGRARAFAAAAPRPLLARGPRPGPPAQPQHPRAAVACRVLTESAQLAQGSPAPAFALPEPLTGKTVSIADYAGRPLLLMVLSNHCP